MSRNALGRGLGALIRESEAPVISHDRTTGGPAQEPTASSSRMMASQLVDIDLIDPSPYQPRTRFREDSLAELARSIQAFGEQFNFKPRGHLRDGGWGSWDHARDVGGRGRRSRLRQIIGFNHPDEAGLVRAPVAECRNAGQRPWSIRCVAYGRADHYRCQAAQRSNAVSHAASLPLCHDTRIWHDVRADHSRGRRAGRAHHNRRLKPGFRVLSTLTADPSPSCPIP